MGRRKLGAETVYAAAECWVERGLRSDDSLFTPGKRIWTSEWLDELHRRFLDRPDESGDSFLDKLERQLKGSPPEAYQLMGEVLFVHFLVVSTKNSTNKQHQLNRILGWSPEPVSVPSELAAGLAPGLATPGMAFHTFRWAQVGFIIEFASQWKLLGSKRHRPLLDDPWAFKDFVMDLRLQSVMLRDYQNTPRIQRQALLHLVHPDTFEKIVSVDHKNKIAAAFEELVEDPETDVDRRLQQIRSTLAPTHGETFSFYDAGVRSEWDDDYGIDDEDDDYEVNAWDEFIENARDYVDSGRLDSVENDYKVKIGQQVATARDAVLAGATSWPDLVKRGISGNLIHYMGQVKFRNWVDEKPDASLRALLALWGDGDISVSDRVRAFAELLPRSASSGAGTRMTLASVLLMGLDVWRYPPFRTMLFDEAYQRTGYEPPNDDADEAELYDHALGFLDRLMAEASERGLALRHRLDAQSVVWAVIRNDKVIRSDKKQAADDEELAEAPYSVKDIVEEGCFLKRDRLEEILQRWRVKKNLILQGPPGTGKTWLAKKLAFALIGSRSRSRVRPLQFHPNLSYEDFVRGWRPSGDTHSPLELVDGPFLAAVEDAKDDSARKFVVVIEEINRGNPAQIFGEMLTLLEADKRTPDEALALSYPRHRDERVHIPDNLYVVGTMNIADRSLALVDLALRRRFAFVDLEPVFGKRWRRWVREQCGLDTEFLDSIERRLTTLNEKISDDDLLGPQFRVGHSVVTPSKGTAITSPVEWFTQVVDTEIGPLLDEYWFDAPDRARSAKEDLLEGLDG